MEAGGSSATSNGMNQDVSNAGTAARVFSAKRRRKRTGSSSGGYRFMRTTYAGPLCSCH